MASIVRFICFIHRTNPDTFGNVLERRKIQLPYIWQTSEFNPFYVEMINP